MPEIICGLCEATIDEKDGSGTIVAICARCRRELAIESKTPCPERPSAFETSYPIRQDGFAAFAARKARQ